MFFLYFCQHVCGILCVLQYDLYFRHASTPPFIHLILYLYYLFSFGSIASPGATHDIKVRLVVY